MAKRAGKAKKKAAPKKDRAWFEGKSGRTESRD
jgi:hypothetical protein